MYQPWYQAHACSPNLRSHMVEMHDPGKAQPPSSRFDPKSTTITWSDFRRATSESRWGKAGILHRKGQLRQGRNRIHTHQPFPANATGTKRRKQLANSPVIHHQMIRRNFLKIKSKFRKIILCHRNSTINLDKVNTVHCQNFRGFGYVAVEQLSKETCIIQWWGGFEKGALYWKHIQSLQNFEQQ